MHILADEYRYAVRRRNSDGTWTDVGPAAPLGDAAAKRAEWAKYSPAGTAFELFPVGNPAVRRLSEADAPRIAEHLLALPSRDRMTRFHCAMADDAVEAYCRRIDWSATVAVGAFSADGRLVGLAEAVTEPDDTSSVDVGVSVLPEARRRGMAQALCTHAVGIAGSRGAERAAFRYVDGCPEVPALVRGLGGTVAEAMCEGWVDPAALHWWREWDGGKTAPSQAAERFDPATYAPEINAF